MLEIDHVFAFVEPPGDWSHVLENAGFRLDSGTRHEGQGTRNRRLLLERSYIEWIWLENRAEAEANPMRLDRRADWRTTGFNSFGIVLRGSLDAVGRDAFEQYVPPYAMPVTMWIARACAENPEMPLIVLFDMPDPAAREKIWPVNRVGGSSPLLAHAGGATRWKRLVFRAHSQLEWPLALRPPELVFERGDRFGLDIELDGTGDVDVHEHVRIRGA